MGNPQGETFVTLPLPLADSCTNSVLSNRPVCLALRSVTCMLSRIGSVFADNSMTMHVCKFMINDWLVVLVGSLLRTILNNIIPQGEQLVPHKEKINDKNFAKLITGKGCASYFRKVNLQLYQRVGSCSSFASLFLHGYFFSMN